MTPIGPMSEAVYGFPPAALAVAGVEATQVSPLSPGSAPLEDLPEGSLARIVVAAPGGALERRYILAHALRALAPGGELVVLAPKTRGGARLRDELLSFGCDVHEDARRHHRICRCERPPAPVGLSEAIERGGLQPVPQEGLWSQPGVFSWNRLDPGTALLIKNLPELAGAGADLGCGAGVLGREVLRRPQVASLWLLDIDRRAVDAARRNLADARAQFLQADVRSPPSELTDLNFVVMNPPFHVDGQEDRTLGVAFIQVASRMLRRGGRCLVVANIALPYEAHLATNFSRFSMLAKSGGFKVYEAIR